jgi:glycerol-3-phosphate dehydrogenase
LRLRLMGRHGLRTASLLEAAHPGELAPIETTPALWAELRWAARAEDVVHLDDLLLRRVRLGLLLPNGGLGQLEQKIRPVVQPELGWTDTRWQSEAAGYANVWKQCYDKPI